MAKFVATLPTELIDQFQKLYSDTDKMLEAMVEAGAKTVETNVRANAPASLRKSNIMKCLKRSRAYRTPSDKGINAKVGFYGYFTNHLGKETPAPMVVNMFEYGRSGKTYGGTFQKQPFFRRSFKAKNVEQAMLSAQKEASGGLLK